MEAKKSRSFSVTRTNDHAGTKWYCSSRRCVLGRALTHVGKKRRLCRRTDNRIFVRQAKALQTDKQQNLRPFVYPSLLESSKENGKLSEKLVCQPCHDLVHLMVSRMNKRAKQTGELVMFFTTLLMDGTGEQILKEALQMICKQSPQATVAIRLTS